MKKIGNILNICLLFLSYSFSQDTVKINSKEFFGDYKARQIGPALMSGRVTDIEGHPNNNKTIYIGSAGGGVWKSMDGGMNFFSVFDQYNQSIGCVSIDPNDPDNSIWVGTGECWTRNSVSIGDGIYHSEDGGKNWKKMGLELSERISSIQIHPKNKNIIYVGVLGALWGDSENRGVYQTKDGGKTWDKILYIDEKTGCSELVIDKNNPDILYCTFWEFRRTAWSFSSGGSNSAIYKSIDGGKTWNKIHQGLPSGKIGRMALALSPSNSSILYAVVEAEKNELKGLYKSEDAGLNWKQINSNFELTVRPFYFSRIVVDPKNNDIVAKAGLFGSISRDGGKTFKNFGSMHSDIHDIWFDVSDSEKMIFATDGGVYRSNNSGANNERVENLPLSQFYHVSTDLSSPYNVYGGLQDNGSWVGPSDSPGGIEAGDWVSVGYGDGFRVYPNLNNSDLIYSEMQSGEGIWRYDKKNKTIKNIKPFPEKEEVKLRFNWNTSLCTSPNKPDRIYIGSQFLFMSDDQGNNWKKISPDLTSNNPLKMNQSESGGLSADNSGAENHCTIFTVAESPLDEQWIWTGTDDGMVHLTKNGGKEWINISKNFPGLPSNTWCAHIEASSFDKKVAYAVFDGHTQNNKNAYVYKTIDAGETWKNIASKEIESFARCIQEDFQNPNLLFLGTEIGLYISFDGGLSWAKFTNGFPSASVHYIDLQKNTNDLVCATHGRGLIILDDISFMREVNNKTVNEPMYFFNKAHFYINEESNFGGTSTENQFVGENSNKNALIYYYLSKRHSIGKMTMEIFDEKGQFVCELTPGKQKGINVVEWNFFKKAPISAIGKTFDGASMQAPKVSAGKYRIVLNKGKEIFEKWIDVDYPKNSVFTLEERKQKEESVNECVRMIESLAYLVYQIDELEKHVNNQKSNPKLKKQAIELSLKLANIKSNLVITKGDNYVGQGEKQLREKLSDIYSTINAYSGAPGAYQIQNLKDLDEILQKEILSFKENKSVQTYLNNCTKSNITLPKIKTFEEFVNKK
ncbi:MAG: hypothetical protein HYU67_02860 [Flavobacteriia bacterium]|nr:hypothetical protein [Flavobacteriia bacterium]